MNPLTRACPKCGVPAGRDCSGKHKGWFHGERHIAEQPAPADKLLREMTALHNRWIFNIDSDDLPHHFRGELFEKLSEEDRAKAITRRRACLRHDLIHLYGVDMPEARAYTKDEAVDALLKQMAGLAHYWATLDDDNAIGCEPRTPLDRINGFAFSMLSLFDGSNAGFPAFDIVPTTPDEDIEFYKAEGEKWFDASGPINDECELHSRWHKFELGEDGSKVRP